MVGKSLRKPSKLFSDHKLPEGFNTLGLCSFSEHEKAGVLKYVWILTIFFLRTAIRERFKEARAGCRLKNRLREFLF